MTDKSKKSAKQIEREERLAKALRNNLQRRKAQIKQRRAEDNKNDIEKGGQD